MYIEQDYFVSAKDWKVFQVMIFKWDGIVGEFKHESSDKLIEEKLNQVINEFEGEKPKLKSVTKAEEDDHMELKDIKYKSDEKEFHLEATFESKLNTKAVFNTSYIKK